MLTARFLRSGTETSTGRLCAGPDNNWQRSATAPQLTRAMLMEMA